MNQVIIIKTCKSSLLVMHHILLSRYSDGRPAISNAYKFLAALENSNVIGVLHGHTHGYINILIGESCRIIGVDSPFAYVPNDESGNVINELVGNSEIVSEKRYMKGILVRR